MLLRKGEKIGSNGKVSEMDISFALDAGQLEKFRQYYWVRGGTMDGSWEEKSIWFQAKMLRTEN